METTNTIAKCECSVAAVESIREIVEGLNAKAAKYNAPLLTLAVEKVLRNKVMFDGSEITRSFAVVTVTGPMPVIQGWSFIAKSEATVSPVNGVVEKIISCTPGKTAPDWFRASEMTRCDHCATKRRRKTVYCLVHEDGRTVQIGSTCLGEYIGDDNAAKLLWLFDMNRCLVQMGNPDNEGGFGHKLMGEDLQSVLGASISCIMAFGFKKSTENQSTVTDVMELLGFNGGKACKDICAEILKRLDKVGRADKSCAEEIKEVTQWMLAGENNDYRQNLASIARMEYVPLKHFGLAVSAYSCWKRDMERAAGIVAQAKASGVKNEVFGEVGKRYKGLKVTVKRCINSANNYGSTLFFIFADAEGREMTWGASGEVQEARPGDTLTIDGTVKAHGEYNGIKQTKLTRCKVVA